ncbi:MAG: Ni/Fe hydrogenase subunit alpha, partial [Anaerolineae bacterium]|nr:Ni/Fe hydrogenase subunit alpha [Anaerolineae bacterium]
IKECRFDVVEAPRFFEAFVRGRPYHELRHITSRICGICSIGHTVASLQGVEAAIGVQPSEQTVLLRKLILHAETVQSHTLHVFYLAVPDFLGVNSVIPLAETHKEALLRAISLHRLANEWSDLIGGRTTHPINMVVNGFTRLPTPDELRGLRKRITDAIPDLEAWVEIFKTLDIPDFERETEYLALQRDDEYAFYDGTIASTDGGTTAVSQYREKIEEFVVPYSTAKHTKAARESFMVGALARFNNNYEQLSPLARWAAEEMGLKPVCYNPFMNNVAQLVEVAHCFEDSVRIINELLAMGLKEEDRSVEIKKGTTGVGATEVPRGLLIHEYTVDDSGTITGANFIIPTNMNHNNIERDLKALVPTVVDKSKEEITLTLEMLVRAYDPCISCSAHLLNVEFV